MILAVSMTSHKEVLSIHIGENESAKYWFGVLNELKNRGVKDIPIICAAGFSGMKEAVSATFPQTEPSALYRSSGKKYAEIRQ